MNENIEDLAESIREGITKFLVPLQTTKSINHEALKGQTAELTRALKGNDFASKSLLNEIFTTQLVIRAEAQYFGEHSERLEEMAHEIETHFSLILKDESADERTPGVPRII